MVEFVTGILINPFYIVLGMSLVTCILGFIGFYEAINWKLFFRSVLTIVITLGLSALTIVIIVVGFLIE